MKCQELIKNDVKLVSNKVLWANNKFNIITGALKIIDGTLDIGSHDWQKAVEKIIKTSNKYLSLEGIEMKNSIIQIMRYAKARANGSSDNKSWDKFTKDFFCLYNDEKMGKEFRQSLCFDLLKVAISRYNCNPSSAQGERLMAFQAVLRTISPRASQIFAANFHGANDRNVMKKCRQLDREQMGNMSCIINRSTDEAALTLKHFIECHFTKESDTVAFSASIDATKVPPIVVPNYSVRAIVGGAHPNHFIPILENDGDERIQFLSIVDQFNDKGNKEMKFAAEIKNGTLSFQTMRKPGLNPYLQLMARPQTKNEPSSFNDDFSAALKKAESLLREEGWNVSFIGTANDGVSCDSQFVNRSLLNFLRGRQSHSSHTDTNHNVKNSRYQLVIGGNTPSIIGPYVVDPGLLKKADIPNDLYRVKDFACDLLVLRLTSAETMEQILKVPNQDVKTALILCLVLYFMRAHLFAVNASEDALAASQRVFMLWTSFLFILHVDGVSITTKRNWASETISMVHVMMRSDVVKPYRLTSEPSEHSFASMRFIVREFTVNDFINIIQKMSRLWIASAKEQIKLVRDRVTGYMSTFIGGSIHNNSLTSNKKGGPVYIETNNEKIHALKAGDSSWNEAAVIWKELMPKLNCANEVMKKFLVNNLGVKVLHPFMDQFQNHDAPTEMFDRFNAFIGNIDSQQSNSNDINNYDFVLNDDDDYDDNNNDDDMDELVKEGLLARLVNELTVNEKHVDSSNKIVDDEDLVAYCSSLFHDDNHHGITRDMTLNVYDGFLNVIVGNLWSKVATTGNTGDGNMITVSAKMMKLDKREKGDIQKKQSHKGLLGRWFEGKPKTEDGNKIKNKDTQQSIKRGTIISISCNNNGSAGTQTSTQQVPKFIVICVFKVHGSKWHPSLEGDDPSWPLVKSELRSYRLLVREIVDIDSHTEYGLNAQVTLKPYEDITDIEIAQKTYQLIKLERVAMIHYCIDDY
jgi:hypothetical protein